MYTEAVDSFRRMAELSTTPEQLGPALVWQGHILDLTNRRDEALALYRRANALWIDQMNVRHDQWKMRIDRAWIEQRIATPFQR
jgi:hypothetical protein